MTLQKRKVKKRPAAYPIAHSGITPYLNRFIESSASLGCSRLCDVSYVFSVRSVERKLPADSYVAEQTEFSLKGCQRFPAEGESAGQVTEELIAKRPTVAAASTFLLAGFIFFLVLSLAKCRSGLFSNSKLKCNFKFKLFFAINKSLCFSLTPLFSRVS